MSQPITDTRTALIIGASRGLGCAMAAELADRGWSVIGTVRGSARTPLHDLADRHRERIRIEHLDITQPEELAPLRERLAGQQLDILFVNAGTTNNEQTPIGAVPTQDFVDVMVTNALSPLRVIEALDDLVTPTGLIGVMSSGQGSITNNTNGLREVYRGSKAALNMFMRSYAARQTSADRSLLLLAPGWIRTALGGDDAPYTVEESTPLLVDVLLSHLGGKGLAFLDRNGQPVPW
ncbi:MULTISPECIES: SDR family oxidoreductase [Streptomyces]|uniref:NAD(P)-dependent dehydrogenase (Short-subunit alcohol dehydrogenase family) n=1 Tax=Streptomyces demainii TaxID=588122 RepID=A0ABT9KVZ4_9ACTN|nr:MULTISPECIES: SDR family NAD(P)-dependent oxidoreductase [Streptomyces]MDN3059543.1 SDR family oxidoreductase [Streptomyces sp. SRF1]MDP9612614.1 NAD(P)-dependent dehydrogenase (short-subunit alcohol dehydrogenase family) [Streptomyces demainii]